MDKEPAATAFASLFTDEIHKMGIAIILILILAAGFLAIVFIQSALDKIFDYKGNLSWMKEQFSKTFLKNVIGLFLPVLLAVELFAGIHCVLGIIQLLRGKGEMILIEGFAISGLALLMLLFGQRVSKQYAGAVSLTGYFIIVLIGLFAAAMIS